MSFCSIGSTKSATKDCDASQTDQSPCLRWWSRLSGIDSAGRKVVSTGSTPIDYVSVCVVERLKLRHYVRVRMLDSTTLHNRWVWQHRRVRPPNSINTKPSRCETIHGRLQCSRKPPRLTPRCSAHRNVITSTRFVKKFIFTRHNTHKRTITTIHPYSWSTFSIPCDQGRHILQRIWYGVENKNMVAGH